MKEFWNQRYSEAGFAYGKEANDFLRQEVSRFPKGARILCIAEGEGRNALFLAAQGFEVTAMDMSEVGMRKAQEQAQTQSLKLETIVANLEDYELGENQWDGIVSIFGHLPASLRMNVHAKIIRALKPGAIFLLEAYTPEQLPLGTGGPKDLSMLMSKSIIDQELTSLKSLVCRELRRTIHEGKYHHGESAVIQYIGQKSN